MIAQIPLGLIVLGLAVVAFVGSHFLLSHALRRPVVAGFGLAGFRVVYSAVAAALLMVIVVAYRFAPHGPWLWSHGNGLLQLVFCVVGYFAVALFVASLFGNPGLVGANLERLSMRLPHGVYRITRHPMMFAIAIWCAIQMMLLPSARNIICGSGFTLLALVGARMQDAKHAATWGREWTVWAGRTPFWPDLRQIGGLGLFWLVALVPWLLVTWLETLVTFTPIGLWYFLPDLRY